jgi:Ankyrin repeat.
MRTLLFIVALLVAGGIGFFIGSSRESASSELSGIQWTFSEAASQGHVQRLKELHKAGAEIDAVPTFPGGTGYTALWCAADRAHLGAVSWLLQEGANPFLNLGETTPYDAALFRLSQAQKVVESFEMKKDNAAEQGAAANP